jgi:hypothetical protein
MAFLNKGLILTLTDMSNGHDDEKGDGHQSSCTAQECARHVR